MADKKADETSLVLPYIGEDALHTYDGWLKYQCIDPSALTADEAAQLRQLFDEGASARAAGGKVGRMKLKRPGESTYAIAMPEGADLWLALWIRRSMKGEIFIFHPTVG